MPLCKKEKRNPCTVIHNYHTPESELNNKISVLFVYAVQQRF